ncbi:type I pullulanase [Halalkalibacter sp. AB-rgal2]|uniref:type I pullulanase n=1 Tax=Halalkalibacter sp. AB-rgal2 TaxID=3242695 RepID=UPI00359EC8C2
MSSTIAWLDDVHDLRLTSEGLEELSFNTPLLIKGKKQNFSVQFVGIEGEYTAKFHVEEPLPLGEELSLYIEGKRFRIYPRKIIRTDWFEQNYTNINIDLGAICTKDETKFRLWAPTATSVKLYINNNMMSLKKYENGIWQEEIQGDMHGMPYEYELVVNGEVVRAIDPYTKALLANSEKGVVVDLKRLKGSTKVERNCHEIAVLNDAIIYEIHVRDATISEKSGVREKGKFIGLTETKTTTPNGFSTGISYIKDLGITHVQLLPINDFARVNELEPEESYNWGYDPLFFQVPEGSYSTDVQNPITRLEECKEMISSFHKEGLGVIVDVVFNHVYIREESSFEKIVPGYYFRYDDNGEVSNGTGVGNDFATERIMARKFILDSIEYWLQEYQVDGFRFDLMGAMDVETIKAIEKRCQKEERPILLLGEGWDLPTALRYELKTTPDKAKQLRKVGFFNDLFRDSLKGQLFSDQDQGYVNGEGIFVERLPHLITGSVLEEYGIPFVSEPSQSINYVECHDNHTLWDRLANTNPIHNEETRKRMHQLATGITLLSQGIPFLHAGQEWFRTKHGDENSYISGDKVNKLDWEKREVEAENIEFIRRLMTIRKKYPVFRLRSKEQIRKQIHFLKVKSPILGYILLDVNTDLVVFVNPTDQKHRLRLPSSASWEVIASNDNQDDVIYKGEFAMIKPFELCVLEKSRL